MQNIIYKSRGQIPWDTQSAFKATNYKSRCEEHMVYCYLKSYVHGADLVICTYCFTAEPEKNADPDNEVKVQNAMTRLSKDKTVIMIAHRLSTVKNCDCIYVLENGKIKEQGSAKELYRQNGIFRTMMDNYTTSVKWKVGKE